MEYISHSPEETIQIAKSYAKTLVKNDVVILDGDMGAGKTVFTKGIALGLGITANVVSPTYAYMNDYDGILYHYDCYRLRDGNQAVNLGLTDYFEADGICVVEWAENIKSVLPRNLKRVTIKVDGDKRIITL